MAKEDLPENKRTARDLSFGLQQTIICWITDVITDPFFSMLSQNNAHLMKWFGDKSQKKTNYMQQVKSEVTGDLAAFAVFVPLRRMFRKPFDMVAGWVKNRFDGRLDKIGRKVLAPWARRHNLTEADSRYQHRLEEFKDGKAHDIVDSSLIGVMSLGFNTVSQKVLFKSEKPWGLVAVSKTIGMVVTVASMLGFRTLMPRTSHKVDKTLDNRVFGKAIGWVDAKTGNADTAAATDIERHPEAIDKAKRDLSERAQRESSHAERRQRRQQEASPAGGIT